MTVDIAHHAVDVPVRRGPSILPGCIDQFFADRVLEDVQDAVLTCLRAEDVGVVSAAALPQNSVDPSLVTIWFNRAKFDGLLPRHSLSR